ncbi:MAG: hypothetical protein JXX14_13885 [Deltaproteobacteria bacterium]|nr:hypothetical protein [Deltaproteobacteria bacterium]
MKFEHDTENDIIIALPDWCVVDEADCKVWYKEWEDYMKPFGRKMDCIMILDGFKVDSGIAAEWGEYRAKVNKEYIRFGYRVHPDTTTNIYIKTSGVKYNAATNMAPSIKDAVAAIKDARELRGL